MRTFLLGTDWWSDCDDVVAMRILARAAKREEIKLAGVCINACMEDSVASVDGFLKKEGLFGIPLGIDRKATGFEGITPYQKSLSQYAVDYHCNDEAEDGIRFYRRILTEAKEKMEIIEIGFLQVMAGLLESQKDDISEKSGLELVEEKVAHIWVMAGKWDEEGGLEHNFCLNECTRMAAHVFCEKCPVPVTFLGFEIGLDVITGKGLPKGDILYEAMCDHGSANGRHSWDPMLVLLALIGEPAEAGYDVIYGRAEVEPETGKNYFTEKENGLHRYVIRKFEPGYYEERINARIR